MPSAKPTPVMASRLHCPRVYAGVAPWVPAMPDGVSGTSRLVPAETPAAILMCEYRGMNTDPTPSGWAISGRHLLTGNIAGMVNELTWQPRGIPGRTYSCSQVGGPQFNYLIGLTYANHATMWVSVTDDPNWCVTGTNGEFATDSAFAGADATKAYRSGTWPTPRPANCQLALGGRLADSLVPAGSTSVTICGHTTHVITSNYQPLVTALNALKTHQSNRACSGEARPGAHYSLVFGFPVGPPDIVNVDTGCRPPIDNGTLQANTTGNVVSIIQQLGRRH